MKISASLFLLFAAACALAPRAAAQTEILNASYDLSGEFYAEFNPVFEAYYQAKTGQTVHVRQSDDFSSQQARAVLNGSNTGFAADVVTCNQQTDIQLLVEGGLVHPNWMARLPYSASPYRTLTVFVVRAGNPKKIKSWENLAKKNVKVVAANPETSSNGRYAFLGAAASAHRRFKGNEARIKAFLKAFYANAPVLPADGRQLTSAFVEGKSGDVLVTFESEALRLLAAFPNEYEEIVPRLTVSPDFPLAVVDKVVEAKGTRVVAEAYADYLFSEAGQELAAKHHYRVVSKKIMSRYAAQFPAADVVDINMLFGSWPDLNRKFFGDGGWFDQVSRKR